MADNKATPLEQLQARVEALEAQANHPVINVNATPWPLDLTSEQVLAIKATITKGLKVALEAQAGNLKGSLTSSTPPPVATDEELDDIWHKPGDAPAVTFVTRRRALYDLGVAHGQAGSREVAEPAPVAGEMAELVADLRIMAAYAAAACQFSDGMALTRAANILQQLGERVPAKGDEPAPVAGGLVPVAGELVPRVARAIHPDYCADFHLYLHEARAATLEVATWLRERHWNDAPDLLEQEARR
jgi:hypothetical protein